VDLDGRLHDFLVNRKPAAHGMDSQASIMGHQSQRAGIGTLANPADVQIGDGVLTVSADLAGAG
jgi:hypothetical protein